MSGPTCHKAPCYAPIACEGFGYCRELNLRVPELIAEGLTVSETAQKLKIGRDTVRQIIGRQS